MQETWKPIAGYEELYEVSDLGRVRSLGNDGTRVLKGSKLKNGYLNVCLSKNGNKKTYSIHRLVALTFIPNPNDLPQVNHINEDKTDNRVVNLEWVSAKENCNHGTRNERMGKTKSIPLVQLTLDYQFLCEWQSVHEIEREFGFGSSNVNKCCQHKPKHKTAGGYRWLYLKEYEEICYKVITAQHPFRLALPYRA